MKYVLLSLFITLALIGCITDPKPTVIHRELNINPDCVQHEDSVTFTDTSEVWHYSCRMEVSAPPQGGSK